MCEYAVGDQVKYRWSGAVTGAEGTVVAVEGIRVTVQWEGENTVSIMVPSELKRIEA